MTNKTLTIITRLTVDPGTVTDAELMERARRAAAFPFGDGHYTGDTDAEIESWDIDVRMGGPAAALSAPEEAPGDRDAVRRTGIAELCAAVEAAKAAPPPTAATINEDLGAVQATVERLCHEIEQMRGMFDDADGNTAAALRDAGDAAEILGRLRGFLKGKTVHVDLPVPTVILTLSEGGIEDARSTHPLNIKVLDGDTSEDWDAPKALVNGEEWDSLDVAIEVDPRGVEDCLRQIDHAQDIVDAFDESGSNGAGLSQRVQDALDELVADAVMGRHVAKHGSLDDEALAEAEAEASAINNQGLAAQVCEVVAHGDITELRALAGLAPAAAGPRL